MVEVASGGGETGNGMEVGIWMVSIMSHIIPGESLQVAVVLASGFVLNPKGAFLVVQETSFGVEHPGPSVQEGLVPVTQLDMLIKGPDSRLLCGFHEA